MKIPVLEWSKFGYYTFVSEVEWPKREVLKKYLKENPDCDREKIYKSFLNAQERRVIVKCICWKEKAVKLKQLKTWRSKSCWCMRWVNSLKHWESQTKMYRIFQHMQQRCGNPNNSHYKYYWEKGIQIEWENYIDFKKDMWSTYVDWLTIDRIDNDWNYSKNNCRWATAKEQSRNRSNTIFVVFEWEKIPLIDLCERLWKNYHTVLWYFNHKCWRCTTKMWKEAFYRYIKYWDFLL